jgi:polysaccharide biosynthesis protein PslH
MITPYLPFPLVSGGQIRTYNLLKSLHEKHEITLMSFIRDENERKYLPELKKYAKNVYTFKKLKPFSPPNVLKAGLTSYPALMTMYLSNDVKKMIGNILKTEKFDLIHAETFYVMSNIPKEIKIPQILVEQTIEYKVYQSYVSSINFLPLKKILGFDVAKIKKWETYYWRFADKVITMSEADKQVVEKEIKKNDVDVVPNGVDTESFFQIKKTGKGNKTVLFLGNFKWIQNKEAIIYLRDKVWPLIVKKMPEAKLWIVGRNPSREVLEMAGGNIKVESVEDIKDAFAASSVLLAPMLSGGGTRYKILEAMASSTPVVSTTLGVEGLDVKHNRDVYLGESPEELADLTVKILENENLANDVVKNAKQLIAEEYNWLRIAKKLDSIYESFNHNR